LESKLHLFQIKYNTEIGKVTHDEMYVADASAQLDGLMRRKPFYNWWQQILIGGMCSSAICTVSFGGSFVDALMACPLGALLVGLQQLSSYHVLYANIFEFVANIARQPTH